MPYKVYLWDSSPRIAEDFAPLSHLLSMARALDLSQVLSQFLTFLLHPHPDPIFPGQEL